MVELVEPKPLVTPRRALVLFLGLILASIAVAYGAVFVQGERALTDCSMRGPGRPTSYSTESDFNFFPPRWNCVFRNDQGEVVGRTDYTP